MHIQARPHVDRNVTNWRDRKETEELLVPAQSPDLHPIEHACEKMQGRIPSSVGNILQYVLFPGASDSGMGSFTLKRCRTTLDNDILSISIETIRCVKLFFSCTRNSCQGKHVFAIKFLMELLYCKCTIDNP